ncbi:leucine-rich repeat-containing protein 9-like [Schistocerca nitens]|uniref:leucine-rich repeat-containing protein 9-like n=1 Tax=Schistocerca nitens TaxID=7011 RepID=UPI0021182293|nr:leucine-rich repeat-containing protein 9-like [Schistocerca nitens]
MAEETDFPLQAVAKQRSEDLSSHGEEKKEVTEGKDNEMLTMVSHFYDSIKSLTDFQSQYPQLTTLYITGIPLDSLNGVQHLPHLTQLFAMKCKLRNVNAVEECYHLEKLCLYSNVIQEIPDLKHVQKLQTLWLSGNEISCIKNLESQKNLCELYLNNNKIKEIGSSLKENKNLHTLNLAANPIFSLKEIISLAELPSLTSLILADSQHDMQPMTELLNYSSYIIYHLNKLEILDGYPVDQRERSRVTLFYSNLLLQFRILKYKLLGDYYKEIWIKQEENRDALARFRKWYQIYMSLAAQLERGEEPKCNLQRDDIKTRLDYLSIEVKNWDAEVAEYMAILSTMRKIRLTQLDYELENANNLKFIGYEADTEIVDIFNTIMNSYCCSHIERFVELTVL